MRYRTPRQISNMHARTAARLREKASRTRREEDMLIAHEAEMRADVFAMIANDAELNTSRKRTRNKLLKSFKRSERKR